MNRKRGFLILGILILFSGIFIAFAGAFVNTSQWHYSDNVSITFNGTVENLNPVLNCLSNYACASQIFSTSYLDATPPVGGHSASQIWVSTKYGEMTLLNALNSSQPDKLCPASPPETSYTSHPPASMAYHYGTEIQVTINSVTESLQDAINGGFFCYYWNVGSWGTCFQSGTETRTLTCNAFDGSVVDNGNCTTAEPASSQSCTPSYTWTDTGSGGMDYSCLGGQMYSPPCSITAGAACSPYGATGQCHTCPNYTEYTCEESVRN